MHNYTYIQREFPNQPCFFTGWLKEWILPRASSSDLTSKEMISWMDGKCFRPVKYTPTYANFVFSPFNKCATLGSLVLRGCLQKGTAKSQKGHQVMILGAFSILRRSDMELDTIYIYTFILFPMQKSMLIVSVINVRQEACGATSFSRSTCNG